MKRKSLIYYVAELFLKSPSWISEDEIMGYVGELAGKSKISPSISPVFQDEKIPEVVDILRNWVHSNVVLVNETSDNTIFCVNDEETIRRDQVFEDNSEG